MWRTLFAIFYISAAVLANKEPPNGGQSERYPKTDTTCPKGFQHEGMYCYHVITRRTNWLGAVEKCNEKNASLAQPLTEDIDRRLRNYIASPRFKSVERWIDVTYNPKSKQWVLGRTTKEIPYDGFVQKKSEMELERHCAVMDPRKSYAWLPQICHKLNNYVCQTAQATNKNSTGDTTACPKGFFDIGINCYYIGDKNVTWNDASKICKEMNSTLVKSMTNDIDRQLRQYLADPMIEPMERWIDVRYNTNTEKWVSGTTRDEIPYDGFWENQSTVHPDKHCAVLQPRKSYAWVPRLCHELKYAICQISLAEASTSSVLPLPLISANLVRTTERLRYSEIQANDTCPEEFSRGGINCYYVSKKKANWFDAIQICRAKNSSLPNPLTEDITKQLRNYTAMFSQVKRWIDVTYDPNNKGWVVGTTGEMISHDGFRNKTSKKKLDWHCAVVVPSEDFAWKSRLCHRHMHYICQMPLEKLGEELPEKRNSSETIEQQETESHMLKTDGTPNRYQIPQSLTSMIRRKKESSSNLMNAPETEPSVKNLVKSQDSNVPVENKKNLKQSLTGNYRTESRSSLIEPTRLTSDSFDTESLLKP